MKHLPAITRISVLLLSSLWLTAIAQAEPLTARSIMEKVDTRYTGDSSLASAQMILIDKNKRERVRDLRLYTLELPAETKTLATFLSPTDVAGTAYLNYDYDAKDDDSWLYLPALKQVRRVAAGDKSGSFMGSDFTYSDMNGINIDWYNFRILKDSEMVDGVDTWLIESTPKPEHVNAVAEETGYDKSHLWIRKDNFVQIQAQIWVTRGKRVKYFSAGELELIDNIWTAKRLQMITTRNGKQEHASVFQVSQVLYNQSNDESLFTTQAMERGVQ